MWRAFGRMPSEFLANKRARPACSLHVDGPIAQLVEQLAFNQWVAGSSPARLTSNSNNSRATVLMVHGCSYGLGCE
jgi:hypothetical protein